MDWRISLCAATVYRSPPLLCLRPGGLLLLFIAATAALTQPRLVSDTAGLYAAFVDVTVTHIRLAKSIQLSVARGFGSSPLLLGRNCVVDGSPGTSYLRLDFNYATNDWVRLGPGVTITFRGLVLVNIFSRSQLALDFFTPSATSSFIVWEGVVDQRSICRPLQDIRNAWSKADLGSQQQQQQLQQQMEVVEGPGCVGDQGCYSTPVLRIADAVLDSPAGYRLRLNNTLVVCEQFISPECIQSLGSDLCYINAIEDLLSKRMNVGADPAMVSGSALESSSGGLSTGAQAGIIGGCVVGGVAVLLLVILLLLRNQRLRRRRGEELGGVPGGFSVLGPPLPESDPQAIGSSQSADIAAANPVQQLQQQERLQVQLPGGNAPILQSGSGAAAAAAGGGDKQLSQDTASNSTDVQRSPAMALVAALVSARSSARASVRPSGSDGRDMPYISSGANMPASLPRHSHQSDTTPAPPPPPLRLQLPPVETSQHRHGSWLTWSGGGGDSSHTLGSALLSLLRSVLSRTGSHTHGHGDRPVTIAAAAATGLASSGGSTAGAAGTLPGSSLAATATDSPGTPRGAVNVNSGTHVGLPRKSFPVEQKAAAVAAGMARASGRPSIGEIHEELDRMEERWLREGRTVSGKGRMQSFSPPIQRRSPQSSGGGGGGGEPSGPSCRQPRGHRRDRDRELGHGQPR